MRIFKSKLFHRWARKHQLDDEALVHATKEIKAGLVDADLGGHVFKKRIATKGRGKSGSVRTLLAYSQGTRTFYIFAFEKADKDNISSKEKAAIKLVAHELLNLSDKEIELRIQQNALYEVRKELWTENH